MANHKSDIDISKYFQAEAEVAISLRPKAHMGENIKHYRVARGFSQEYLAEKLGISQVKLSRLEKKEDITEDFLIPIATILGLDIVWLRDIPLTNTFNSISMDTKGNYFQNGGHAMTNYSIQFPVETMIDTINQAAQKVEDSYIYLLKEKDKLLAQKDELIKTEREAREILLSRISNLIMEKFDLSTRNKKE